MPVVFSNRGIVTAPAGSPPVAGGGLVFVPESGIGVSGTVGDMLALTFTSSSLFGTKPNGAKPLAYFPHSSGLGVDTTYSRDTATAISAADSNQYAFTTSQHPVNSAGCCAVTQNDTDGSATIDYLWTTPRNNLYCFHHRNVTPDIRTWVQSPYAANLKQVRARASINSGVPNTYMISGAVSDRGWMVSSDTTGGQVYHETGLNSTYMPDYDTTVWDSLSGWHTVETWFRSASSDTAADGQAIMWVNGARVFYYPESELPPGVGTDRSTSGFRTCNGDPSFVGWNQLAMIQCSNQPTFQPIPPSSFVYYGPTLIDDSPCRILLSDESAWNTSSSITKVRDFCLPTAWGASSITAVMRKGIHSTMVGKYAYAVLSDGYTVVKLGQIQAA